MKCNDQGMKLDADVGCECQTTCPWGRCGLLERTPVLRQMQLALTISQDIFVHHREIFPLRILRHFYLRKISGAIKMSKITLKTPNEYLSVFGPANYLSLCLHTRLLSVIQAIQRRDVRGPFALRLPGVPLSIGGR